MQYFLIISFLAKSILGDERTVSSEIKIFITKNFANPSLPPSIMMMSDHKKTSHQNMISYI